MSDMDDLHEAPLLDLLRRRHAQGNIYTYSNFVLISVNPHRIIPGVDDGPIGPQVKSFLAATENNTDSFLVP